MTTLLMAAVATLVFCAPGYPGGAGDAQPLVDRFAISTAATAGWPVGSLRAIYDSSEQSGLAALENPDAAVAFVPYAFFVQHGADLRLSPIAQADVTGVGTEERWTLIAKAGTAQNPASLAGYTLLSVAGYAPEFIRHSALQDWKLPLDVKIESTGQILSALRRIVAGEHVVALLDQTQTAALSTLPFAAQLQSVTQSPALPVAIMAVVDSRLPLARVRALQTGLLKMSQVPADADDLTALHLAGFVLPRIPTRSAAP